MANENESTIADETGLTEPGSPVESPVKVPATFHASFRLPDPNDELLLEDARYRARGLIYYVSAKEPKGYPVKIGRTTQSGLASRLTQLQIAMPYWMGNYALDLARPNP
jgi:hypothetical protein